MHHLNITIATITLARNEAEANELAESLQQLALLDIPVVVADGGSIPSFKDFLHSITHFKVLSLTTGGVWLQAKASLEAAHKMDTAFILYSEPDKKMFFQKGLLPLLQPAYTKESSGILIASRSQSGFSTFPAFQQMTETCINKCCEEVTGKMADYCYGPFLLNKKLVPYLGKVTEDIGWGWRPYIFAIAHRLGYDVATFIDDYECPKAQRQDDAKERVYRMKQLEQNIRGLVFGANSAL